MQYTISNNIINRTNRFQYGAKPKYYKKKEILICLLSTVNNERLKRKHFLRVSRNNCMSHILTEFFRAPGYSEWNVNYN